MSDGMRANGVETKPVGWSFAVPKNVRETHSAVNYKPVTKDGGPSRANDFEPPNRHLSRRCG